MKKNLFRLAMLFVAALTITSCSDDENEAEEKPVVYGYHSLYVVNNGSWGANNGTVAAIDTVGGKFAYVDLYAAANNSSIGDVQDIALVSGKIFATSTTSDKVSVLDKDGKLLYKTPATAKRSPRFIISSGDFVYFTAYSGYLYKMNTTTYQVMDSVLVGDHPEALAAANGKIYVAMSDYSGKGKADSLSVINIKNFKKTGIIKCSTNPYNQMVVSKDGGKVFFVSNTDYVTENILQYVDTKTDEVTKVGYGTSIAYDAVNDDLIVIYSTYYHPELAKAYRYDIATGKETEIKSIIENVKSLDQVSVDGKGNIYVVSSNYAGPCKMYVFDQNGALLSNFEAGYDAKQVYSSNE